MTDESVPDPNDTHGSDKYLLRDPLISEMGFLKARAVPRVEADHGRVYLL